MNDGIFADRRLRRDRRDSHLPVGASFLKYCRRKESDRRFMCSSQVGDAWWLMTRYVDREMFAGRMP